MASDGWNSHRHTIVTLFPTEPGIRLSLEISQFQSGHLARCLFHPKLSSGSGSLCCSIPGEQSLEHSLVPCPTWSPCPSGRTARQPPCFEPPTPSHTPPRSPIASILILPQPASLSTTWPLPLRSPTTTSTQPPPSKSVGVIISQRQQPRSSGRSRGDSSHHRSLSRPALTAESTLFYRCRRQLQ
jgi:hypothetical protein